MPLRAVACVVDPSRHGLVATGGGGGERLREHYERRHTLLLPAHAVGGRGDAPVPVPLALPCPLSPLHWVAVGSASRLHREGTDGYQALHDAVAGSRAAMLARVEAHLLGGECELWGCALAAAAAGGPTGSAALADRVRRALATAAGLSGMAHRDAPLRALASAALCAVLEGGVAGGGGGAPVAAAAMVGRPEVRSP